MEKWMESHPMVLFALLLIAMTGGFIILPTILDIDLEEKAIIDTIIISGDIIKVGYAQGIEETSIVEIVREEIRYWSGDPYHSTKKVIGETVIGKLVQVEFEETGLFFKKNNVVLTFEDSEDGKKATIIIAKCAKQQIWQKGKIQEITIINGEVESVKRKNYEI